MSLPYSSLLLICHAFLMELQVVLLNSDSIEVITFTQLDAIDRFDPVCVYALRSSLWKSRQLYIKRKLAINLTFHAKFF